MTADSENWQASEELSRPLRLDSVTAQKEYQVGPAVLDVTRRGKVQDFGVYSSAERESRAALPLDQAFIPVEHRWFRHQLLAVQL
jgi:hypothetical protein